MALTGGALIGLAVTLMLLFNGRVTGISGIINQALRPPFKESSWRWAFLFGLLLGGLIMSVFFPELFLNKSGRGILEVLIAGFLVGFGTVLGSGCTSGHGVCGISRLSRRSILATITFMFAGFLMVNSLQWLGWAI